jgi:hypothetical protein
MKLLTGSMSLALAAGLLMAAAPGLAAADVVARAQFTTGIEDREPVDQVGRIGTDHQRLYFFTEIRDFEGEKIVHRWVYRGETEAAVDIPIGGPRWRVWSSKAFVPEWTGEWTVEVVDGEGNSYGSWSFRYGDEPAMEPEPEPEPEAGEEENGND